MFSEQIKKTTAALYKNGEFIGSSVIYSWKGNLFAITAAHNLFGIEFDQKFSIENWQVQDYKGEYHNIKGISDDVDFCKKEDIILIKLECASTIEDFITPYFSTVPSNKVSSFLVRGKYGKKEEPVNKQGIHFDEKYNSSEYKFLCTIDKEQLANNVFAFGSEWLDGFSGSGLFYENRKDIICVGVLLEIPDKGDNGQLLFCSVAALEKLGFGHEILSSEIFDFNPDILTDEWFEEKLQDSINALGKRYTPKLNFELPIGKIFNGISRNELFKKDVDGYFEEIFIKRRRSYHAFSEQVLKDLIKQADEKLIVFKKTYLKTYFTSRPQTDYLELTTICNLIYEVIDSCIYKLYEEQNKQEEIKPTSSYEIKPFHSSIYELYEIKNALGAFISFLNSPICSLSNEPYVILKGEAGFGKSHLLADVATKRKDDGKHSLILLGQNFVTAEDPWHQILSKQLRIEGDENNFLGMLNTKAQLSGHRILLIIDAINEGNGKNIWKGKLKSFIQTVRKFEWLGLIVSVRTTYQKLLIDETIYSENIAKSITHHGFSELEYEAADYFFDNYGISKPRIPFLHPEFRSPLFLKLFCDGLFAKGLKEIPEGYEGITAILDFFLEGINEKLALQYQFNPSINLVKKSVESLAQKITENEIGYISLKEATYFLNDQQDLRIITDKSLFTDTLIHEGVFTKNLFWNEDRSYEEGLSFSYERFFDHIVASNLLNQLKDSPLNEFKKRGRLFKYIKDDKSCNRNSGLIEALSVQIPEKYDLELFELLPGVKNNESIVSAFVHSIIWRKRDSFIEKVKHKSGLQKIAFWLKKNILRYQFKNKHERIFDYLNINVFKTNRSALKFFENILLITSVPDHIFNANYLHDRFLQLSLADRDAIILPWLTENYYPGTPITRLIDWAWKDDQREYIDDESILLSSITLSWFLISSNRPLRDSATKSLICLLQNRGHLIVKLLKKFEIVNDPYVYERLFGVAYGCSIRAEKLDYLPELCDYIVKSIFNKDVVYPNILLRDYARGVVDYANKNNLLVHFDMTSVSPPYSSQPILEFPTNDEIDKLYKLKKEDSPYYYYQNAILSSMTTEYGRGTAGYGDFGRYIFENTLDTWDIDINGLSNYAVKRIFELGYDINKHGKYDSEVLSGRGEGHSERIGKKYQWIIFHEILARVADNNSMYNNLRFDNKKLIKYQGAWNPNVKDIDLSIIIKSTRRTDNDSSQNKSAWWLNSSTINWDISNKEWMQRESDIPPGNTLINILDSHGVEWLCLEMMPNWDEERNLGEDPYNEPHKRMYLQIKSFLVKENDFAKFKKWAENQEVYSSDLPDTSTRSRIFSREFYWSDAYMFFETPYYEGNGYHDIHDRTSGQFITNVHVPVEDYLWEKDRDNSIDNSVSFYKPSRFIWKELNLKHAHSEGEYNDINNELVCLDPSVKLPGPSSLLVRKDLFIEFLQKNKLRICWSILGQKQILSSKNSGNDDHPRIEHKIKGLFFLDNNIVEGKIESKIKIY